MGIKCRKFRNELQFYLKAKGKVSVFASRGKAKKLWLESEILELKIPRERGSEGFHCVENHNNNKYQIQPRIASGSWHWVMTFLGLIGSLCNKLFYWCHLSFDIKVLGAKQPHVKIKPSFFIAHTSTPWGPEL